MRLFLFHHSGMQLSNLMYTIPESVPTDPVSFRDTARAHEKLGDIYSGLEMHGRALVHYQFMVRILIATIPAHFGSSQSTLIFYSSNRYIRYYQ